MRLAATAAVIAGLTFLCSSTIALADNCPGINTVKVDDGQFSFIYESWVLPPDPPKFTMYRFGRCVQLFSGPRMSVDWHPVGVSGSTAKGRATSFEFPFIDGLSQQSPSSLCYGGAHKCLNVMFLDHAATIPLPSPSNPTIVPQSPVLPPGIFFLSEANAVISDPRRRIDEIRNDAVLPTDLTIAKSTVELALDMGENVQPINFKAVFESGLPGLTTEPGKFTYHCEYELTDDAGATIIETGIKFRPESKLLQKALAESGFKDGEIPWKKGDDFTFNMASKPAPTMLISNMQIVLHDKVIGSFPFSYYGPSKE